MILCFHTKTEGIGDLLNKEMTWMSTSLLGSCESSRSLPELFTVFVGQLQVELFLAKPIVA